MWGLVLSSSILMLGCERSQQATPHDDQTPDQELVATDVSLTSAPVVTREARADRARLDSSRPNAPIVGLDGMYVAPNAPPSSGPRIASIALETRIFAAPDRRATLLGFLRAGAVVAASADNYSGPGCAGGYAKIQSPLVDSVAPAEGYVCLDSENASDGATRDLNHPIVVASAVPADLSQKLPYIYGTVKRGGPVYARFPPDEALLASEPNLASHLARWKRVPDWGAHYGLDLWERRKAQKTTDALANYSDRVTDADIPDIFLGDRVFPNLSGQIRSASAMRIGEVSTHNGVAFLDTYLVRGRRYGVTTDLRVIPTDRFRAIRGSEFHGVRMPEDAQIPFAIVRGSKSKRYRREGNRWIAAKPLEFREIVSLTGRYKFTGGVYYYETNEGDYIDDKAASKVEPLKRSPGWATKGEKWIDINVSKQLLTAYEGETPVYATLVSTGEAGLGDPETTKSTRLGIFRIHTKFVTATMDSKTVGEEFELRDVPYVQYFQDGYALHAAYWHDVFGMPKSHGCVNLAPEDARRIFHWTEPQVPDGWHGVRKALTGTVVFIHR